MAEKPDAPPMLEPLLAVEPVEEKADALISAPEQEPDEPPAPGQPIDDSATLSAEHSQAPNLEDWMKVQEAFGAFQVWLKFEALSGLSQSDQVASYILQKDIPIRILDVVWCEAATTPGNKEVKSW